MRVTVLTPVVHFPGFVLAVAGYPAEQIVQCIEPLNYPGDWSYGIWLKGRWSNTENLTSCIDPNLCYDDPPALPSDYSVNWNQTTSRSQCYKTFFLRY
jgi:hypothetical protein